MLSEERNLAKRKMRIQYISHREERGKEKNF
jgi:hypothetical protein